MGTLCVPTPITRFLYPAYYAWLPGAAYVLFAERLNPDDLSDSEAVDWELIDESDFDDDY